MMGSPGPATTLSHSFSFTSAFPACGCAQKQPGSDVKALPGHSHDILPAIQMLVSTHRS